MANERIHDAFKAGLKKKLHKAAEAVIEEVAQEIAEELKSLVIARTDFEKDQIMLTVNTTFNKDKEREEN